jgi:hypothetical protein
MKHQLKISKRKEGEIMHLQKSRQYVAKLDSLDYIVAQREFHQIYDKILVNFFVARIMKLKMISLMFEYTKI